MYRAGMKSILSELARQDRLILVDKVQMKGGKTKEAVSFLKKLDVAKGTIVLDEIDTEVVLATRNLINVFVTDVRALDPVSLVSSEKVIMTTSAAEKIQEWLS